MAVESPDRTRQYINAFNGENGQAFFMSVTRRFGQVDAVITNHRKRYRQIEKAIQSGRLLYSTALNRPEGLSPKQPTRGDGSQGIINTADGQVNDDILFQDATGNFG